MFQSTKLFDGYSTIFRQWRAEGTHCKYIHGYGVSFRIWFEGELDEKNWVWDFGGMKRAKGKIDGMNPKEWNTIKEASSSLKLSEMYIIQCCKGKREQYKNYKWTYK